MDETDIAIIHRLLINSRVTYRELADEVNLTVSTVHKRVQSLVDQKIIDNFSVELGIEYLRAVQVHFFGTSPISEIEKIAGKLENDKNTSVLHIGSNDYIHVGGLLRDISELDDYTDYIKEETSIDIENMGILSHSEYDEDRLKLNKEKLPKIKLTRTDKKIISSLHKDARKTITDISEETNLSAKTVKRSIDKLIENKVLEFSIEWNPSYSGDMVPIIHIYLTEDADKKDVYKLLENSYSDKLIFNFMVHNLPSILFSFGLFKSLNEIEVLKNDLEGEQGIEYVKPNLIFSGNHFKTWRNQELENILKEIK